MKILKKIRINFKMTSMMKLKTRINNLLGTPNFNCNRLRAYKKRKNKKTKTLMTSNQKINFKKVFLFKIKI